MSFFIFFVLLLSVFSANSATIGARVNVPDTDSTLQDLINKSVVEEANNQIHDSNWWIPSKNGHYATKVSVLNNGKMYTTYDFQTTFQRSACAHNIPVSKIKNCKAENSKAKKIICKTSLAWNDRDYSSIEQETYCG